MIYTGTLYKGVIVAKGINYTDYVDEKEIELTEEQYNTIQTPCKLVDGEFIPCEYPRTENEEMVYTPTAQDDIDALLIDHEYRLTLLELGVSE